MKKTNLLTKLAASLALLVAPVGAQTVSPTSSAAAAKQNDAIELSPFVVNADTDVGYVANSSLAGSRLNTPLRDTGAAISVLTAEFLSDIGAIDLPEALQWANNVQLDVTDTMSNPNDNGNILSFPSFRIRGVDADITRNYFKWRLSTDAYNIERIEEQRGPNSILFGIGSAGGILNSTTKQAMLGRDFQRAALVTGSYGSIRGTLDVNQRASNGRLAVRLNAVHGHQGNFRHHAFNDTRRLHLATTFKVAANTTLRAEYETGDLDQVNSRNSNIIDGLSRWLAAGQPTIAAATTNAANLAALGLENYGTAARVTYVATSGQLFDLRGRNFSSSGVSTFQVFDNPLYADRTVNTGGPGQKRWGNFNTVSIFSEQRLAQNTFLELAYNHQADSFVANISGQGSTESVRLRADPHQLLPNGQTNPYAGRLMLEGPRFNRGLNDYRSDNTRLTLSHEQDLGKWGNYRLAALAEYQWRATKASNQVEAWADRAFSGSTQGPEAAPNLVYRRNYVTQGDWASYYVSGPAQTGLIQGLVDPVSGRTLSSTWVNFNINVADNPEYQKTLLLGGQARYFKGRLVAGVGVRRDWLDLTKRVGRRAPTANGVPGEYSQFYDTATSENYTSNTKTLGLVAHLPWNASAFFNASNSFGLPNTGIRILPDSKIPPNPESSGWDAGLAFAFLEGKINLRLSRYVNDLKNAGGTGFGGSSDNPTVLANTVLGTLVRAGLLTQAQADARTPNSNGATTGRQTNGYEVTLSANPTRNWRLQANYSYTRGADDNIAPEVKSWAAENIPYYLQYASLPTTVDGQTIQSVITTWQNTVNNIFALEGLSLRGNRRHKINLFTRYNVPWAPLKGLFVGGGYRHLSKSELGLDATNAITYGNSYWLADALAGYHIARLPLLKRGATLQLNVANVFDWETPITTRLNSDGTANRWNILEPRTWRLSASIEF